MALTPFIQVSQGDVTGITFGGDNILASQSDVVAIFNVPAIEIEVSAADLSIVSLTESNIQASQADVTVIYVGRPDNSIVRVWTYTLDSHEFYVLRLGDELTLVYDTYSEQWMDWNSKDLPFWRVNCGTNWIGAEALASVYGSNIVAGDDTFGLLWFLDPEQPYDQPTSENAEQQQIYFERITMGQVPMKGREVMPCYAAWLTTDMGAPAYDGAAVTLQISDDGGRTFDDCGAVEVTLGEFSPEIAWYSLGQIEAPGRLFKIIDDGAVVRIDGLEMNDPDDDGR